MLKLILSVYAVFLPSLILCDLKYGQHFPNGKAAVDYIYGPEGMWKRMNPLQYYWNYYERYATKDHPFGKDQLIKAANGSAFYTTRDANGYLFCDAGNDQVI